jgi:hypothetical protein
MISEDFAKRQIMRLSRLRNFPLGREEAPLRADIVAVLRGVDEEQTAKHIVEEWLIESTNAPTISELNAIVRQARTPRKIGCPKCEGTGFLLWQDAEGRNHAAHCTCHPAAREAVAVPHA